MSDEKRGRPRFNDGLPDTMSRQRRYQLRQAMIACCILCGAPTEHYAIYCDRHAIAQRKRQRQRLGTQRWKPGSYGHMPIVFDNGTVNTRRSA